MFKFNERTYKEEMGDDGSSDGEQQGSEQQSDENNEQQQNDNSKPDWLLDKYHAGGKSIEEATAEQAKAYTELSSKFGAFTGAPEEYEIVLSDELKDMGISIDKGDPMVEAAFKFAKDSNMNQEKFNEMLDFYTMQSVAEQKADIEYKEQQMKALGENAGDRVTGIKQWADKNLDAESVTALEGMVNSVESVKAIEQLISMTRAKSINIDESSAASSNNAEELRSMQFAKDEHGNRKINIDPEFRKRYEKMKIDVHGTGDYKQIIG